MRSAQDQGTIAICDGQASCRASSAEPPVQVARLKASQDSWRPSWSARSVAASRTFRHILTHYGEEIPRGPAEGCQPSMLSRHEQDGGTHQVASFGGIGLVSSFEEPCDSVSDTHNVRASSRLSGEPTAAGAPSSTRTLTLSRSCLALKPIVISGPDRRYEGEQSKEVRQMPAHHECEM